MLSITDRLRTTVRSSPAVIRLASLALVLVTTIAVGAMGYFTQRGIAASRDRVVHSYRVRAELDDLQLDVARAEAVEAIHLWPQRRRELLASREDVNRASRRIEELSRLTSDNPPQQQLIDRINRLLTAQKAAFDQLGKAKLADPYLSQQTAVRQRDINSLLRRVEDREESLLEQRQRDWDYLFKRNALMLGLAFAIVAFMLAFKFRALLMEIKRTRDTERRIRENADSLRLMSAKILELQDLERQRIARELHDSVGQNLAGLKINLAQMRPGGRIDPTALVQKTIQLTDSALQEVRTISHLLHPPLLDELGFLSAARWYVEEYAKYSQVRVALAVDGPVGRLPREVEIALYRVLQESLTNVYRHAAAHAVDIRLACRNEHITMTIADDGKGIPRDILSRFHDGSAPGIGLGGMRERLAEFGGVINVQSSSRGSVVQAIIPTRFHPKVSFQSGQVAD